MRAAMGFTRSHPHRHLAKFIVPSSFSTCPRGRRRSQSRERHRPRFHKQGFLKIPEEPTFPIIGTFLNGSVRPFPIVGSFFSFFFNHLKNNSGSFQSLEDLFLIFPIIGTFLNHFSNHWKKQERAVTALPVVGKTETT